MYDDYEKYNFCEYQTACHIVKEGACRSANPKTVVVGTDPYASVVASMQYSSRRGDLYGKLSITGSIESLDSVNLG